MQMERSMRTGGLAIHDQLSGSFVPPLRQESVLPNRLKSGQLIEYKKGRAVVCGTTEKDSFGEPLYRLRYESGVKGNARFTRDELQQMGCKLIEE